MNEIVAKANQKIEKQLGSSFSSKKYIYMTEERKQALLSNFSSNSGIEKSKKINRS